jgi:hypothetical protein
MSAFASYASPVSSPNTILPPVNTTGTGGSTYKYESSAGGKYKRKYLRKTYTKRGGKSCKNKKRGCKSLRKSQKK